jgi:flagellar FliJ protein
MKRFRFPLRPVAVLRAHRELRAREAFAAAVHACAQAEEELAATRARVAQFEASLSSGRHGCFSAAAEVEMLAGYRGECAAEAEAGRAVVAAKAVLEQRRTEYLDAHRKLEVVKRLEAKARLAHRVEAGREEQAEFDEFASRRSAVARSVLSV